MRVLKKSHWNKKMNNPLLFYFDNWFLKLFLGHGSLSIALLMSASELPNLRFNSVQLITDVCKHLIVISEASFPRWLHADGLPTCPSLGQTRRAFSYSHPTIPLLSFGNAAVTHAHPPPSHTISTHAHWSRLAVRDLLPNRGATVFWDL